MYVKIIFFKQVGDFLRMIKVSHTIFAFPFTLIGFFFAWKVLSGGGAFPWATLVLAALCLFFARSAAMGFNRWADAEIDARNERTKRRELPAGIIAKNTALLFVIICAVGFFVCAYFINSLCFALSFIALPTILLYSYMKRFSYLSHFVLGLSLAFAPMGASLAVAPVFSLPVFLLSFAVLFWVGGFDIIYALQDEDFDSEARLFSVPAFFGRTRALNISRAVHVLALILLAWVGVLGGFGFFYWLGFVLFSFLLVRQHYKATRAHGGTLDLIFFTNNGLASVLFALCTLLDLLLR